MEANSKACPIENNNLENELAENNEKNNVLKRKRKKSNYKKINNETRQKLIEMVRVILL
jgi:hypothetical protein